MILGALRTALLLFVVSSLFSGCSLSTIQEWFPDKHKNYQYSTEIPPLEFPPDLSTSTIEGIEHKNQPEGMSGDFPLPGSRKALAENSIPPSDLTPSSSAGVSDAKNHPPPVMAQSSDNIPLIEIKAPFDITWAEVNKALGRMKLEVSDLNRADGTYHVHYNGNQEAYEDKGVFGDMADLFGSNWDQQAKEFRIKLEQHGVATSIFVLDLDGKPQREGRGLELLKWLFKTLHGTALGGGG